MAEAFDPYLRWLGIRDPERPPNHYRLLGLEPFESDPDIIAGAADRQMAHLRTFKTGQYVELSQRLLNELAAARVSLLKPDRKAAYDEQLRRKLGSKPAPPVRAAAATPAIVGPGGGESPPLAPTGDSAPSLDQELQNFRVSRSSATARKSSRSKARTSPLWIVAPLVALAAAVGIAVYVANSNDSSATTDEHRNVAENTGTEKRSPAIPSKGPTPETGHGERPGGSTTPNKNPRDDGHDHHGDHTASNPQPPGSHDPNSSIPTVGQPAETVGPPKPPIQSPGDVMRVVNPAQASDAAGSGQDPTHQVASVDTGHRPDHGTPDHGKPKPATPAKTDGGAKAKRAPVPSKDEITAAEAKIQKLFNVSAAKRPDERAALAKTLFEQGLDANNAPADRYVCLRTAMKDAAALGDADLALKAVDKLTTTFDVSTLEEKVGVLSTLGKMVRAPEVAAALVTTAESLLDDALDADDFDSAKSAAQLGAGFASKAGNATLAKEFRQRVIELDQIKKEYATAAPARDTLQSKPDDPDANYVWGYYLGPIKGTFDKALPFLALGNNDSLRLVATKELTKPADPTAQVELGDSWSALAEKSKPGDKVNMQSRAAMWYSRALPKLKGIARTEVDQKLDQIDNEMKRTGSHVRIDPLARLITSGRWRLDWKLGGFHDLNLSADHTATFTINNGSTINHGTWAVEQGVVVCRWKELPTWTHKIRVANDRIEAENYDNGKLTNTATARLLPP